MRSTSGRPSPEATSPSWPAALVDLAEPPLRLFIGTYPYDIAETTYARRLSTWREWRDLAASGDR